MSSGQTVFVGQSQSASPNNASAFGLNYSGSGSSSNYGSCRCGASRLLIALTWNGTGVLTTTTGGLLDDGNGNASFKGAVTLGQNKLISNNGNAIALPSSAGTLALTSQLPSIYSCWSARTTSAAGSSDGTYHFAFSALPSVGTGAVDCSSGSSGYQILFNTAGT